MIPNARLDDGLKGPWWDGVGRRPQAHFLPGTGVPQGTYWLDGTFVLHNRRLRSGVALATTARFGDDAWPLAPAALQGQERGLTLRFGNVPGLHRHALKRLAYTSLSGDLPADEQRPSISSIVSNFYNVAVFLRWLNEHHTGLRLAELTDETFLEYQGFLLGHHRSASRRQTLRSAVVFFWRYRKSLGNETLSLNPRTVVGWTEPQSATRYDAENNTARIPEDVHSRVLIWALRFVDDFAEDILNAVNRWEDLRTKRAPVPRGSNRARIEGFLGAACAPSRLLKVPCSPLVTRQVTPALERGHRRPRFATMTSKARSRE